LAGPNLTGRGGVFRRYDHMVGDSTVIAPGGDAAMLRVKGTRLGLAVTTDCNARYCHLDPHLGAQLAVAEAARNIVATGARPLAVTDCLNFANPDRPEVYWELEEAIAGLAYACRSLELPVVSGIGVRCPAVRPEPPLRLDAAFFAESPSRYIVSVASRAMPEMQSLARRHNVELSLLGLAGGDSIEFEGQLKVSLDDLRAAWESMVVA